MIKNIEIKELKNKIQNLKNKDIDLIIADFDDTIFSTKELIEKDYRKGRRGKEGNKYMEDNNLFDTVINDLYKNKKYPDIISSKLRKNHDLILTAGYLEFQTKKIKAVNLEHINTIVVDSAEYKIIATIKYIISGLKFIPNKITIYEDRPQFFIDNKKLLEDIIGIKIDIFVVKMTDNISIPLIKKIDNF